MRSSQLRFFLREVSTSPYICENAIFEKDVHIRECSTSGSCYLASRRSFEVSRRSLLRPEVICFTEVSVPERCSPYRVVCAGELFAFESVPGRVVSPQCSRILWGESVE